MGAQPSAFFASFSFTFSESTSISISPVGFICPVYGFRAASISSFQFGQRAGGEFFGGAWKIEVIAVKRTYTCLNLHAEALIYDCPNAFPPLLSVGEGAP